MQGGSWLPCWDTSLLFVPSRKGSGGDWENGESWELGHVRGQEEHALHQRGAARGAEVHHPPATRAPLHCCGHPLQGLLPSQGRWLLPPRNPAPSPDSLVPLENGFFRGNYRTEPKTMPRRVSVLSSECVTGVNPVPLMLRTSSLHDFSGLPPCCHLHSEVSARQLAGSYLPLKVFTAPCGVWLQSLALVGQSH